MKTMNEERLKKIFDRQAAQYDSRRKKKETVDQAWRKEILSFAKGRILEVCVGAGSNFRYYPKDSLITGVDISEAMVEKAKEAAREEGLEAIFLTSRVEQLVFPPESFDTIVSTFSLCAYEDPVEVLNKLGKWCRKDGIILLMEHGTSRYKFLHWIQNRMDKYQYPRIGCHANRDILALVKTSDLEIKMYDRKFLGAIYWSGLNHLKKKKQIQNDF